MTSPTLYIDAFRTSPYALSAWVTLREKEIPFEVKTLDLSAGQQHAPEYIHGSLTGRVPAFEHEGFWLSESQAIVEYLEERFPAPKHRRALPVDMRDRARARQLMAWIRSDLMPIREERPTSSFFYANQSVQPLSPRAESAVKSLLRVADVLIPEDRTQLFGEWSIADTDFAVMLQRLRSNGHTLPAKVVRYVDAQWNRPLVKEWVEMKRPPFLAY